jgi:hypothetical protein
MMLRILCTRDWCFVFVNYLEADCYFVGLVFASLQPVLLLLSHVTHELYTCMFNISAV